MLLMSCVNPAPSPLFLFLKRHNCLAQMHVNVTAPVDMREVGIEQEALHCMPLSCLFLHDLVERERGTEGG